MAFKLEESLRKFQVHQFSHTHREAQEKWMTRSKPSIESQASAQVKSQQETRHEGLVVQMKAIQYLCRQRIALRGHAEIDGNFKQLMRLLADRPDAVVGEWKSNKYKSHDSANEMISILSLSILRKLLAKIKDANGMAYFSVVCDEATDVTFGEQLNLSIRWVSDSYKVHEDPVGLFRLPNTYYGRDQIFCDQRPSHQV